MAITLLWFHPSGVFGRRYRKLHFFCVKWLVLQPCDLSPRLSQLYQASVPSCLDLVFNVRRTKKHIAFQVFFFFDGFLLVIVIFYTFRKACTQKARNGIFLQFQLKTICCGVQEAMVLSLPPSYCNFVFIIC